jgi:hypothetical protein
MNSWAPVIGVVIGFLLSQFAGLTAWLIASRREKRLTRLLVALEVTHDLKLLGDYWENVALPSDEELQDDGGQDDETAAQAEHGQVIRRSKRPHETEADRLARRAVEIPLPVLSVRAMDSQLAALPRALAESQIRDVWRFYEDLAQVQALHLWLVQVSGAPEAGMGGFPSASRAVKSEKLISATFTTKKGAVIFDLRRTIQSLLEKGNPVEV